MKIIVDNGGTKSDWMVVDQNRHFSDIGINLFDTKKSIVSNFKSSIPPDLIHVQDLTIDFYTAGNTVNTTLKLKEIFKIHFPNIQISIFSDLLAASRAVFKNEKGITCILGTGSNCAYYDGNNNHSFFVSSGHIFADEGSGYDLGKRMLQSYFRNELSDHLEKDIHIQTGFKKEDLISHVYSLKNHKPFIASLSKIVNKNKSDHKIKEIIFDSFEDFFQMYPFKIPNYKKLKFGFIGSIAFNFQKQIHELMCRHSIEYEIIEKPILNLANYYRKKS